MHYVIIGNGIIALSSAFALKSKCSLNDSITIIGSNNRQCSASAAAAAMLNVFAEVDKYTLQTPIDRLKFDLCVQATEMWPNFLLEMQESIDTSKYPVPSFGKSEIGFGTYVINNTATDALEDINYQEIANALKAYNQDFIEIDPTLVPNYKPSAQLRATRSLFIAGEGWVNPKIVLYEFECALKSDSRISFVNSDVSLLTVDSRNNLSSVTTTDGNHFSADKYLIANGASLTQLLSNSHVDLPVQDVFYGVGLSLEISTGNNNHSNCVRTPNRGLACGIYTAPYQASDNCKNIIIGASNFISPKPYAHARLASFEGLLNGAIRQINSDFYRADFISYNVGWRPTSQDTYPLVGKTSISNLFIASGTKRDGFHLAPVWSEFLASLIIGSNVDTQFEAFLPERKLIKSLSRLEAIEKACDHQINAAYQHGFVAPNSRLLDQLRDAVRSDLEKLHDKVGAYDWGIPSEMIDMYRYGHASSP